MRLPPTDWLILKLRFAWELGLETLTFILQTHSLLTIWFGAVLLQSLLCFTCYKRGHHILITCKVSLSIFWHSEEKRNEAMEQEQNSLIPVYAVCM